MTNFPRKAERPRAPVELSEIITPSHVQFLGEQTGPRDDAIKKTIRVIFDRTPWVFQRAYLARVSYGEPGVSSVALCVRNRDDIEEILLKRFKHMFAEVRCKGDFYDWIIVGEEQEQDLKKVCKPFYEVSQPEQ